MYALESASPASFKTPATFIDSIHSKQSNRKKQSMQKLDPTSKQIMSNYLALRLQNPELRGLDLEPSPKRGSNKINMQKEGRNTQKKIKSYSLDLHMDPST